jgi:beta-lactamase superfamily II metal-dependent hydrolase
LNVGHGDSIVLEFRGQEGQTSFAVIDSNCAPGETPRALELLQSLNATHLSFVSITHPHADHYMGMQAILQTFSGRIGTLYTFPIRFDGEFLKKVVTAYKKHAVATDDAAKQSKLLELAEIFRLGRSAPDSWEAPAGLQTAISAAGFDGVRITSILPPAKIRGDFFDRVVAGKLEPEREQLNDLSTAFLVEYAGHQIILGGDGTYSNWIYQHKRWNMIGLKLSPGAVKIPHHGSELDCRGKVFEILYGDEGSQQPDAKAIISANGKTHPSPDVLDALVARRIAPYCTNLARRCGANRRNLVTSDQTDPVLVRFLNSASIEDDSSSQPCQGDITLQLQPGVSPAVFTQHANLCPLRGDYDFLSVQIH